MEETVLCYLIKNNSYLMLKRNKKKNDINENKYIGVGGHIENGESIYDACKREVLEETGYVVNTMKYHGKVLFKNNNYEELMHLFTSDDFNGTEIICDEGELHWIPINKINELYLWDGDKIFLPMLKEDKDINLVLEYNNNEFVGWYKL